MLYSLLVSLVSFLSQLGQYFVQYFSGFFSQSRKTDQKKNHMIVAFAIATFEGYFFIFIEVVEGVLTLIDKVLLWQFELVDVEVCQEV